MEMLEAEGPRRGSETEEAAKTVAFEEDIAESTDQQLLAGP